MCLEICFTALGERETRQHGEEMSYTQGAGTAAGGDPAAVLSGLIQNTNKKRKVALKSSLRNADGLSHRAGGLEGHIPSGHKLMWCH